MKFAREHRRIFHSAPIEAVTCIFMGGLMLHTILLLCYFWGHFDDPVIRRLSLPSHLLFIVSFLYIFPSLVASARRWQWLSAISLLFIFSVTAPLTAMHRYNQENFSARANNWLNEYIDTLGEDSVLAIDENNSLQWFLHKKSSISVGHLARNVDKFEFVFRNRSFEHFLIVQRMGTDFETGARFPNVGEDTGDGLVLEPIAERSFSPIYTVRISRVVGMDIDELRAWAALRMTAVEVPPDLLQEVKEADYDRLEEYFRMLP